MSVTNTTKRHTIRTLAKMKHNERIAMLTAYDVMTANCLDKAGVDILLVGDSLANVVYGHETTLPIDLDTMIRHTAAVVRGSQRAFIVCDMPFMTFQISPEESLRNAGRCLAEAGAQAVKMEGASEKILKTVSDAVDIGIPVMGHIGLTPQSVHQMGGYYKHGKSESDRERLLREAKSLEQAGCFAVVLECVEEETAKLISQELKIITIGIGSAQVCDGEVLVINDVLGYTLGQQPKFATPKMDLASMVIESASAYVNEVKEK